MPGLSLDWTHPVTVPSLQTHPTNPIILTSFFILPSNLHSLFFSTLFRPYFDDVDGIIFMAALSSFDQCCEEDERMNRMKECVVLFNSVANHKLFADTAFILFMNKIDVFQRKLDAGSLVKTHFAEYDGPNDYATASAFLHSRFLQQCKDTAKQIYTHFTHATVSCCFLVFVCLPCLQFWESGLCIGGLQMTMVTMMMIWRNRIRFFTRFRCLNCAMWWHNSKLYTWLVIPCLCLFFFLSLFLMRNIFIFGVPPPAYIFFFGPSSSSWMFELIRSSYSKKLFDTPSWWN